jgi:hypothetical protein
MEYQDSLLVTFTENSRKRIRKSKLDLVGIQVVTCDEGGYEHADNYAFLWKYEC